MPVRWALERDAAELTAGSYLARSKSSQRDRAAICLGSGDFYHRQCDVLQDLVVTEECEGTQDDALMRALVEGLKPLHKRKLPRSEIMRQALSP